MNMKDISDLRRNYTLATLSEKDVMVNPLLQFELWLNDAIDAGTLEPTAMCLSTVDEDAKPSSRIVLLKQIKSDGFIFFTNYESRKGKQIEQNPHCALNFVWHELERQVRVEGVVEKVSATESDSYFERRPVKSKLGAWASPQSKVITDRECVENLMVVYEQNFSDKEVSRPPNWGGYILKPRLIEFWQGRSNRLHDRIQFRWDEQSPEWIIERLAP